MAHRAVQRPRVAHSALRMKGQLGSWLGLRGPEVIPKAVFTLTRVLASRHADDTLPGTAAAAR